jgi:hypothetical protein
MRSHAICGSFLAALIVVALFWGNCLSCPQMLLAREGGHACCHRTKAPAGRCQSQGLQSFVKAEAYQVEAPAVSTVAELGVAVSPALEPATNEPVPAVHAPPDPLPLLGALRI